MPALRDLDESVLRALYAGGAPRGVFEIAQLLSFIGSGWVLIALTYPLLVRPWRLRTAMLLGTVSVTSAIVSAIKAIVGRVRPCNAIAWAHTLPIDVPTDPSFPSGHAAGSFAFACFAIQFHRPIGIVALVLAPLISLSRVALGVHYPADVVLGAVLGAAIGIATGRWTNAVLRAFSATKR
jgi:undecaprenyl-diphosphatase